MESRTDAASLRACPVCGARLTGTPTRRCPNRWCQRHDRGFSVVFPVGVHGGALRHGVLRYKYRQESWWAKAFAGAVARHLRTNSTWFEDFDLITGVPAYTGPGARRRWDPVGGVLRELEAMVGPEWEVVEGVAVKTRETPPMTRLGRAERRAVAEGPLRRSLHVARPEVIAGARVLLVDDVMTEGSTLREVATVLRLAGAVEVAGLVLARLQWSAGLS